MWISLDSDSPQLNWTLSKKNSVESSLTINSAVEIIISVFYVIKASLFYTACSHTGLWKHTLTAARLSPEVGSAFNLSSCCISRVSDINIYVVFFNKRWGKWNGKSRVQQGQSTLERFVFKTAFTFWYHHMNSQRDNFTSIYTVLYILSI